MQSDFSQVFLHKILASNWRNSAGEKMWKQLQAPQAFCLTPLLQPSQFLTLTDCGSLDLQHMGRWPLNHCCAYWWLPTSVSMDGKHTWFQNSRKVTGKNPPEFSRLSAEDHKVQAALLDLSKYWAKEIQSWLYSDKTRSIELPRVTQAEKTQTAQEACKHLAWCPHAV